MSGAASQLAGQTVVVLGGSAGIGLETARLARAEGADVIITGRDAGRLEAAAREVGTQRSAAFDAFDAAALQRFLQDLPAPIDHVMVTAGAPRYGPLLEMDAAQVSERSAATSWWPSRSRAVPSARCGPGARYCS